MARVFISYARKDGSEVAHWLHHQLESRNIEAFLDVKNLNRYGPFDKELEKEIDQCTYMIVCGTPDLKRENSYCHTEISLAQAGNKRIIPLNLGHVPLSIKDYTWIDFTQWETDNSAFAHLLQQLKDDELRDVTAYLSRYTENRDFTDSSEIYFPIHLETSIHVRTAAQERALASNRSKSKSPHTAPSSDGKIIISEFETLFAHIQDKYHRIAFIGDPGAGKSTTLKRLSHAFAIEAQKSWQKAVPDLEAQQLTPLPIFIELNDYRGGAFEDYLDQSFGALRVRDYLPDRVVFLLDGLNEISTDLAHSVLEWVNTQHASSIIVSCRKLNYDSLQIPLHPVNVKPLDVTQIQPFMITYGVSADQVERLFWALAGAEARGSWDWYQRLKPTGSFEGFWFGKEKIGPRAERSERHLQALRANLAAEGRLPGLLGVVTNPFLLKLVIKICGDTDKLPTNRHDIFDEFVDKLIEERGKLAVTETVPWIDEATQKKALSRLAYEMQFGEDRKVSVKSEEAKKIIQGTIQQDPQTLLTLAVSANIIEYDENVKFTHQLLQEYFAANEMAVDIKRGVPATQYFPGEKWWEVTGWEETVILLAGMTNDCTSIVKWLTPVHPTLAYRCATESGAECANEALQALYEPGQDAQNNRRCPIARAAWGRHLAEENRDRRRGIGVRNSIPQLEWIEIPAGAFHMGGDKYVARIAHDQWQGQVINLDYTYHIAKYPITYKQYELFCQEDGYTNPAYWTKAGWAWRIKENITAPAHWDDPYFHIANHPVVGLSWYECYAYSQWLSNKLTYVVRLPTEAEWEKAGRYPDGRFFPWGNDYWVGAANVDETNQKFPIGPYQINRTVAVGLYDHAASDRGVHDLSANIWEWCLSHMQLNYEHHLPEEVDIEGEIRRAVRGGSWKNDAARARLAYRGSNPPTSQDSTDGFRLVRVGYEPLQQWQQRVAQATAIRQNRPKPLVIPKESGQVLAVDDTAGIIRHQNGTTLTFETSDVLIPPDYPEKYQLSVGARVEFEVDGSRARKIILRLRGIVDDWDRERAYGDIRDEDDELIYMHQSVISSLNDWNVMKDGDWVEFEITPGYLYGKESWEARNVRIVQE